MQKAISIWLYFFHYSPVIFLILLPLSTNKQSHISYALPISFHLEQNIAFNHDPGTSDDSGRASERLTTSSVAQRDQDSSRDRLSDVSVAVVD